MSEVPHNPPHPLPSDEWTGRSPERPELICGHQPEYTDFLPCTRHKGHTGPCAHRQRRVCKDETGFSGIELIHNERLRQRDKGYDSQNDAHHTSDELIFAAQHIITDLALKQQTRTTFENDLWTNKLAAHVLTKYKNDPLRRLVISAALITAEIDRRLREDRKKLFEAVIFIGHVYHQEPGTNKYKVEDDKVYQLIDVSGCTSWKETKIPLHDFLSAMTHKTVYNQDEDEIPY